MTKEKAVNYTPEMTLELVTAFSGLKQGPNFIDERKAIVSALAAKFARSEASIRQKASREAVYGGPATYSTKAGTDPVTKEVLATKIGERLSLAEPAVDSLVKASKPALASILAALEALQVYREAAEAFDEADEWAENESMAAVEGED